MSYTAHLHFFYATASRLVLSFPKPFSYVRQPIRFDIQEQNLSIYGTSGFMDHEGGTPTSALASPRVFDLPRAHMRYAVNDVRTDIIARIAEQRSVTKNSDV